MSRVVRLLVVIAATVVLAPAASWGAVPPGAAAQCASSMRIQAAAGAGFGGIWFSPPVDGVQPMNVALVDGTDPEPVRVVLRDCGVESITTLRPAAYPYAAVEAANAEFARRVPRGPDGETAFGGIGVRDDAFVVVVSVRTSSTDDQAAEVDRLAAELSASTGVRFVVDPVRIADAQPMAGVAAPLPVAPPTGDASAGTPPTGDASAGGPPRSPVRSAVPGRVMTTSVSRRATLRTGTLRIVVRAPADGTTIRARTTGGRGGTVASARGVAAGQRIVRMRLTTTGCRLLRRGTAVFVVRVTAAGTGGVERRVRIR